MNYLFLKTSLARLEPEIEQFEVWSTFVGFFAICLVAQGDHKLANYDDDDGDGDDGDDDGDDGGDDGDDGGDDDGFPAKLIILVCKNGKKCSPLPEHL